MTDFKGINPDKKANFNANRQGKGASDEKPEAAQGATPSGDPYADLKVDPNHLMKLLAEQAKLNVPSDVQNAGINQTVAQFASEVSPERHSRLKRLIEQTYTQEFGKEPNPQVLQNILDNYLIGQPVVQAN